MNQQQQNYLQQQQQQYSQTQQARSYGDMHIRRKTSERESSVEYVGGQVKKIAEQVANEKQTIRERLEELEQKVDRIGERSEKFQKIGKLLQSCVDGQEDDLKKLKVQVYEDFETKCKVLEAKFDVDTKLLNQESSLNKKFNQRVRDFDTMAEGFEARIQENYQEFSSEMANQVKAIEDSVENRADQLRREIVALFKDFEKETQYDSLKKEIEDLRQCLIELRQKQKIDANTASDKATSIVTDISFMTKAISEISLRLEQNSIDDEKSKESKKQESNDLKQMVNLLMGKVDRMEKQKTIEDKNQQEYNRKLTADMEKLQNIVKDLQHQNITKQSEYLPQKQQQPESQVEQKKILSKQVDKYSLIAEKLRQRKEFAEEELIQRDSENEIKDKESEHLTKQANLKQPQTDESDRSYQKNNFEQENEMGNTFEDRMKTLAQKRDKINQDSDKLMHKQYENHEGMKTMDKQTKYTPNRDDNHIDKMESIKQTNKDIFAINENKQGDSKPSGQLNEDQNINQNSDSLDDSIQELFNRRKDILSKKPILSAQVSKAAEYQEKQLKSMGLNNSPVLKVDEILSKARPSSTKNSRSIDESLQQMAPFLNGRNGSASDFKLLDNQKDWKKTQGRLNDQNAEEIKGNAVNSRECLTQLGQEDQKQETKMDNNRTQKSEEQNSKKNVQLTNKYQDQQEQLKKYLEFSDGENELNIYNKANMEKIEDSNSMEHAEQLEKEEDELLEQLQERRNRLRQFIEQTEQQLESEEENDKHKQFDQIKHKSYQDKQQNRDKDQQYQRFVEQSDNEQEEQHEYQRGRDKQRVDDSADLIRLRNRIATAQNYSDSQSRSCSRDEKYKLEEKDHKNINKQQQLQQQYQGKSEDDNPDEQLNSQTNQNKRVMTQSSSGGQVQQQQQYYKAISSNSPKYNSNNDNSFNNQQHQNNQKRNSFQEQQPKKEEIIKQSQKFESSDDEIEQALQKYQNTKLAIGQLPKQTSDYGNISKNKEQYLNKKETTKTEPYASSTPKKEIYQYIQQQQQQSQKYNQASQNKQNSRNNSFSQDNQNNRFNDDNSSNSSLNRNHKKIGEYQIQKDSASKQKEQIKYQTENNEKVLLSNQNDNYFQIGDRTRSLLKEDDDDDDLYLGQQDKNSNNNRSSGDSIFYTKGLKYDVNFSTNKTKIDKATAKNFEMIDKVMRKSTQKQRK